MAIDLIIIFIIWFINKVIRPRYPEWWRRHVVDEDVELREYRWSIPEAMRRWLNRNGNGRS